jgi:hypothetical protein
MAMDVLINLENLNIEVILIYIHIVNNFDHIFNSFGSRSITLNFISEDPHLYLQDLDPGTAPVEPQ